MAVAKLLLVTLGVAVARKAKLTPSDECTVTSKFTDGTEIIRDCYVLEPNAKDLLPGTKGRFESCTQ